MKSFIVKYDHIVFKPNTYGHLKREENWELKISANNLEEAKEILKNEHKKNPFYFTITEVDK